MATSSFHNDFVVKDKETWCELRDELKNCNSLNIDSPKDIDEELKRGKKLLKTFSSHLKM
ncbi:hypothetical protein [Methanococcus vannielii]|uniref:hypothetical protein n=1 Tax=Methanococcus vannielii TaxID=2187 RepID=UPI00064F83EC|nr:hypothetical protein [Methanococcus vannielii]